MLIGTDHDAKTVSSPSVVRSSSEHLMVGLSPAMMALRRVIRDVAPTEIPVLLIGESGTGKEIAALEIHRLSNRSSEPFVKCNCAAQGAESLQRRLLGWENGVTEDHAHNGGTVFLDEVSLLDPASQLALLHCLPEGESASSGGRPYSRVISSTTRNLDEKIRGGGFRNELYYRLDGVCLRIPSLRSRRQDIPVLLDLFLKRYAALFQRSEPQVKPRTMDLLMTHSWPGNVRELENVARKIVALGDEDLALSDLSSPGRHELVEAPPALIASSHPVKLQSLKAAAREASRKAERELIAEALERTHWNRKRTARDLQVSYKALLYKMKQLGLDCATETES